MEEWRGGGEEEKGAAFSRCSPSLVRTLVNCRAHEVAALHTAPPRTAHSTRVCVSNREDVGRLTISSCSEEGREGEQSKAEESER